MDNPYAQFSAPWHTSKRQTQACQRNARDQHPGIYNLNAQCCLLWKIKSRGETAVPGDNIPVLVSQRRCCWSIILQALWCCKGLTGERTEHGTEVIWQCASPHISSKGDALTHHLLPPVNPGKRWKYPKVSVGLLWSSGEAVVHSMGPCIYGIQQKQT